MPSITISPNPTNVSTYVTVAGTGFNRTTTTILLDGVSTGNQFRPNRSGAFSVGVYVSSIPAIQRIDVQQKVNAIWTTIQTGSITVQSTTPQPPTYVIKTVSPSITPSAFLALCADMTIDEIQLSSGSYTLQNVTITTDRTARPLTLRPVLGATANFVGPASSSGSIFNLVGAKWITWDGSGGAIVFKDFALAQSGVFQPQGSDHLTFRYLTFQNLSRDAAFSDKAYKSWCYYCSTSLNDHMLIEFCTFAAPAVSRDISAIQYASSGSAGTVTIRNCTFVNYDYVVYDERPTTNITLDTLTLTNCGNSATPASIRFYGAVSIAGTYKNISATLSDPLLDTHTGGGTVIDGGGNTI